MMRLRLIRYLLDQEMRKIEGRYLVSMQQIDFTFWDASVHVPRSMRPSVSLTGRGDAHAIVLRRADAPDLPSDDAGAERLLSLGGTTLSATGLSL